MRLSAPQWDAGVTILFCVGEWSLLDRIASPIAAVIVGLYSDNGIDPAQVASSTPASWPSRWRHGIRPVRRLPRTRPAAAPASTGYVADSPALTPHQPAHPFGRSIFAVIARDFIDHNAIASDLRIFVHAMAHTVLPSF
jgi:hypothetical protein